MRTIIFLTGVLLSSVIAGVEYTELHNIVGVSESTIPVITLVCVVWDIFDKD